jgi:hypothetical protein
VRTPRRSRRSVVGASIPATTSVPASGGYEASSARRCSVQRSRLTTASATSAMPATKRARERARAAASRDRFWAPSTTDSPADVSDDSHLQRRRLVQIGGWRV